MCRTHMHVTNITMIFGAVHLLLPEYKGIVRLFGNAMVQLLLKLLLKI